MWVASFQGRDSIKWTGTLYSDGFIGDGSGLTNVTASSGGVITSVFGRVGAISATTNDYTWTQINKATSNIADITTKSHTSLSDIGTNTHAQIDTHIANSSNPHGTTLTQTTLISTTASAANLYVTTLGSGSGALLFQGTSSQVAGDSTNLYWNDTNNRLGIGTASPGAKLEVNGGNLLVNQTGTNVVVMADFLRGTSSVGNWQIRSVNSGRGLQFYDNFLTTDVARMTLDQSGNVGIGTTSPQTLITASGALTLGDVTAPATPTGGGAAFASGGALYWKGSSGTVTKIANA